MKNFLLEYDFVVLMTLITFWTFASSQILKILIPPENHSNFWYYLLVILLIIVVFYYIKINMYPFDFNDENKIALIFGFKTLIVSYMIIGYFSDYVNFGLKESIIQLQRNVDKLTEITETKIFISPDLIYLSLSFLSAVISITVIHHGIKFAYHYFYLIKTADDGSENENPEVSKQVRRLKVLLAVNFFTPIVVLFFFIPHFSKSIFVPALMDDITFDCFRFVILITIIVLKWLIFYDELQFSFNESYFYIQKVIETKNEKLFEYVQLKLKIKFLNIWSTWFQYVATILIPSILLVCYAHRYTALIFSKSHGNYDFSTLRDSLPKDGFTDSVKISISDNRYITEATKQATIHGLIPIELERASIWFLLFSFYLSWLIVSTIGLLYYRKFKSN